MGFFSYNCNLCKKSIKDISGLPESLHWMNYATIADEDGSVLHGEYDGYGRIESKLGTLSMTEFNKFSIYHKKCWENGGKPGFTGQSESAEDQGIFDGLDGADGERPTKESLGFPVPFRTLFDAYDEVVCKYMDQGAGDTAPSQAAREYLFAILFDGGAKLPVTVKDWHLFSGNEKSEEAARELTKALEALVDGICLHPCLDREIIDEWITENIG